VFVTLRGPDYHVDWDEVRRAVTRRTRVIMVNSPHNPTGMVLERDDLRQLASILEHTDALVVADEVYEHIVFDGRRHQSLATHPDIASRAVIISSFGKTFHTTGWKIGYCAAPEALSAEVARVHQFVTYAVNGAIQRAYAEFVQRDPEASGVASFYQAKRDLFLRLIDGSRFRPLPCRGTYFQMVDYSAITAERDREFALRLINEHGVAAIPVSPFMTGVDPGPVLRFCFAKRDDTLERAAERLRKV
jgi:methionine aminotransferase